MYMRIITLCSDGTLPILQQNVSSGYSPIPGDALMQMVSDLKVFIACMEDLYKKQTPVAPEAAEQLSEIDQCKQKIDALLERIKELKLQQL